MKKIGIITYHFARNYGAVLQCYALQSFLNQKGYYVEVFDFVNARQRRNNGVVKHGNGIKSIVANICLIPFFANIKKKCDRYDNFCNNYLNLSERITEIDELKQYIDRNRFDFIISGSDQVLNPNIADFDFAFLYPFKTTARKITYAASTGNASKVDIQKLKQYIKDFDVISIRERKDIAKFDSDFSDRIQVVCDPVMLLESESWHNMITKGFEKPYLVCYFLHKNMADVEFRTAQNIAKCLGLEFKVINARFSKNSFIKGTVLDAGPKEFVNLIANAEYVCTDSFHGTLFSLIFHKRFTCFDTKDNAKDNRKKGLLENVEAMEAFQYIEDGGEICGTIDYKVVEAKITIMREQASRYLEILNEQ